MSREGNESERDILSFSVIGGLGSCRSKLPMPEALYFVVLCYQFQPRSRSDAGIGKGTSFAHTEAKWFCCAGSSGPASEDKQTDGVKGMGYNKHPRTVYIERVSAADVDPRLEG